LITLRFDQLVRITGGTLYNTEQAARVFRGVSIDSRKLEPGQLFIALRGERNDGHNYIEAALKSGATGLVVEFDYPGLQLIGGEIPVVAVTNSHKAMIDVAVDYRDKVDPQRIGVSGSNGKTTTKEMIFHLLSAVEKHVYRSPGNYNNLFGMPLALMSMPQDTNVAVLEMGISVPGEMSRLAEIVKPDVMVITNVGPSHLEFLGTVEGVARAKLEVVQAMTPDQPLIINADDDVLVDEVKKVGRDYVSFGIEKKATFRPSSIKTDDTGATVVGIEKHQFRLSMFGRYQVYNLLAAYAAVRTSGYTFDGTDTLAIELRTAPMRGEIVVNSGVTFFSDCYNANPDSVMSGLMSFAERKKDGRRLIVLGDMLELGRESERYHRQVAVELSKIPFDYLALVGPMSSIIADELIDAGGDSETIEHFKDSDDCADRLSRFFMAGDLVYVKGSRGIGLEAIMQRWIEKKGKA
jgi:UDP-N-acetylmuramoyl-tripeptide--D-alanyl-D-alanine ligase